MDSIARAIAALLPPDDPVLAEHVNRAAVGGVGARASGLARRFVGEAGLTRAERLLTRYGDWTIVICRPVHSLVGSSSRQLIA